MLATKVERLVWMGGGAFNGGNQKPWTEANAGYGNSDTILGPPPTDVSALRHPTGHCRPVDSRRVTRAVCVVLYLVPGGCVRC